jgi:hypothetical protein
MDAVRAERDQRESQRAVLSMKIDQAHAIAQAQGAADTPGFRQELLLLKIQSAKTNGDIAMASRELNALSSRMMTLANAERARAAVRLETVRGQLRGG